VYHAAASGSPLHARIAPSAASISTSVTARLAAMLPRALSITPMRFATKIPNRAGPAHAPKKRQSFSIRSAPAPCRSATSFLPTEGSFPALSYRRQYASHTPVNPARLGMKAKRLVILVREDDPAARAHRLHHLLHRRERFPQVLEQEARVHHVERALLLGAERQRQRVALPDLDARFVAMRQSLRRGDLRRIPIDAEHAAPSPTTSAIRRAKTAVPQPTSRTKLPGASESRAIPSSSSRRFMIPRRSCSSGCAPWM
jgi:hypothetical protein